MRAVVAIRILSALVSISLVVGAIGNAKADGYNEAFITLHREDYGSAVGQFRTLAERGGRDAQFMLATLYFEGKGVSQNYGEAIRWFREAAAQNDRNAYYSLGGIYTAGLGAPKDLVAAATCYRTAADLGHLHAQVVTAFNYATGNGVSRDDVIAARWFYRAAQQGVVEAQIMLATMYGSGRGVPKDNTVANAWATIAAASATQQENHDRATRLQDITRRFMSSHDIIEAQKLAIEWVPTPEKPSAQNPQVTREQDGIQASLALEGNQAVVRWRLLRPLPADSELSVDIDGKPLGTISAELYPQPGAKTSIVLLLDVSDQARERQINNSKLTLFEISKKILPHHEIDIASYSDGFQLLEPQDGSTDAIMKLVKELVPRAEPAHLGRALRSAIELPSLAPAERRGIFAFTDGHADDALDLSALIKNAKLHHASLNFIVTPGARQSDLSTLAQLADATGGLVVKETGLSSFLEAPFWLLDSGATARVSFTRSPRLFWQTNPEVKAVFHYGTSELELKSTAVVSVAGVRESAALLAKNYPLVLAGSGVTIFAGAAGLIFLVGRRRRKKPSPDSGAEDPLPGPVLAVLRNIADGASYPIHSSVTQLGRASTADVVLLDEAVSRIHAVLQQQGSGIFEIENRSSNGTFVNHKKVEKVPLADGDLITIGSTTLHYANNKPNAQGDERRNQEKAD